MPQVHIYLNDEAHESWKALAAVTPSMSQLVASLIQSAAKWAPAPVKSSSRRRKPAASARSSRSSTRSSKE